MDFICYGCFATLKGDENVCPFCGRRLHEDTTPIHILKPGTVLNQKYTVGKTLGEGGFGITYLAWDNNMQTKIAIKEFYPANLVRRDTASENSTKIFTITKSYSEEFHTGLERFVKEASILAKFFNLPGIVSVKDFFYENGTAYIVMEYIDGITLKEYLKQKGGKLSVEETLALMRPVMESLAVVHRSKMLHRDISPDNLMISSDYQVRLIDFGSARYYDAQSDQSMTVVLKHGYAPIEQYSSNGHQGTWTDVYSLCATMYRMLTEKVPVEAINRVREDSLAPLSSYVKKIPKNVESAILKGLSVLPDQRQQTVEELYRELYMSPQGKRVEKISRRYRNINKFLIRLIVILILFIACAAALWIKRDAVSALKDRADNVLQAALAPGKEEAEETGKRTREADREEKESDSDKDASRKDGGEDGASGQESGKNDDAKQEKESGADEAPKQNRQEEVFVPEQEAAQEDTSAGTQSYQLMRSGAESASQTDSAVVKVKNGRLNNIASDQTVGEILDLYSDNEGIWYTYEEEAEGTFVYYEGQKNGEIFVLEFEVYSNDVFKLTGAALNNVVLERYADFFQGILDSLGL